MIDLSKGLPIENLELLIPWGITNEEAWQIGDAMPWFDANDKTKIKWENAVILDGIECVIQINFSTPQSRLSRFNILAADYSDHACRLWTEILQAQCDKLFGPQTVDKMWRQKNVTLGIVHDERFVETSWLEIGTELD